MNKKLFIKQSDVEEAKRLYATETSIVHAVRYVRKVTGCGLKEAKEYVTRDFPAVMFWWSEGEQQNIYYDIEVVDDKREIVKSHVSAMSMVRDYLNAVVPSNWDWSVNYDTKEVVIYPGIPNVKIVCRMDSVSEVVKRWNNDEV